MCQCNLKSRSKMAFCGREGCEMPGLGIVMSPSTKDELDELKWRVSRSGTAVVRGRDPRIIVYQFPDYATKGISGRERDFEQWLENADHCCESVNAHLEEIWKMEEVSRVRRS